MQTFLPFPSFVRSARVLDRARLGRQRTECIQLLRANLGHTEGYRNHPAAVMWRGYEPTLAVYALRICEEWRRRGYKDKQADIILDMFPHLGDHLPRIHEISADGELPWWFGWKRFHKSHRSNLLRKDEDHYEWRFAQSPHVAVVGPSLPYVWPGEVKGEFREMHSRDSPYALKSATHVADVQ